VIPSRLLGKQVERVLMQKARYEVEKNLSRLAVEWRERVATAIKELTRQAERRTLDELDPLDELTARRSSKEDELKRAVEEVGQIRKGLSEN
jgi:hypothetical protein